MPTVKFETAIDWPAIRASRARRLLCSWFGLSKTFHSSPSSGLFTVYNTSKRTPPDINGDKSTFDSISGEVHKLLIVPGLIVASVRVGVRCETFHP